MNPIHRQILQLFEKKNERGILKILGQEKVTPNNWIQSTVTGEKFKLLPAAIERDWTDLSIFLIHRGAAVNEYSDSVTPLMIACKVRNHSLIEALLSKGADPNLKTQRAGEFNGWTPLMLSAAGHDLWAVRRLLKAGADPRIVTHRKHTAVYFAAVPRMSADTLKVIEALVSARCPLLGYELHVPIYRGDVETTKLLIQFGCPLNERLLYDEARNLKRGETPLTTAVGTSAFDLEILGFKEDRTLDKRRKITRLLLAAGSDPNLANIRGYTPLMLAVTEQELKLADLLVKAGADPQYVPPKANTKSPIALAKERKLDKFIQLFHRCRRRK